MLHTTSLKFALPQITEMVNNRIAELLPSPQLFNESRLAEAMSYSTLAPSKRIRAFLTIASADIFGIAPLNSIDTAVAIEFIHGYSLIHDDLPAMDNDDYRRGQPSCHKRFDEATAILAGDALLTYAFQILSNPESHPNPQIRCNLIELIAKAAGFDGMAGGQMMDIETKKDGLPLQRIARIQRLKTGRMFIASAEAGAILAQAEPRLSQALVNYAHDLGLAFQIKDDIMDYQDPTFSKASPKKADNCSIVEAIGLEKAKAELKLLYEQSISHLEVVGYRANLLKELAGFIIDQI